MSMRRAIVKETEAIAGFEVLRVLGHSETGGPYLARDIATGRDVSLELLHPDLAETRTFARRFLSEVKVAGSIVHPNVVRILRSGEQQGVVFVASEYVDGRTLQELLAGGCRLPFHVALNLTAQILTGLQCAHGRGVVHRDIKPASLIIDKSGVLKIRDFGIAKTAGTQRSSESGGREQAGQDPADPRSDLFSTGVVLYEMLTGSNPSTTVARILEGTLPSLFEVDPSLPPYVECVLEGLLERDPSQRYQSAQEALAEFYRIRTEHAPRQPDIVAEFLRDPGPVSERLNAAQTLAFLAEAESLLRAGPSRIGQASLLVYRATRCDPRCGAASQKLAELSRSGQFRLGPRQNPNIRELEKALSRDRRCPEILEQLAQLHQAEGSLARAVVYMKRYLRLRPQDGHVARQLSLLTGETPRRPRVSPMTCSLEEGHEDANVRAVDLADVPRRSGYLADWKIGVVAITLAAVFLAFLVHGIGSATREVHALSTVIANERARLNASE